MRGIYAIATVATPVRRYIGSSSNISFRWRTHRRHLDRGTHENPHLQSAWLKYGPDGFRFTVLEEVLDASALLGREQWYLDRAVDPFNVVMSAGLPPTRLGRPHSAETKARIRAATLGRVHSESARRQTSATLTGRVQPRAQSLKISAALKGIKRSVETRARMSAAQKRRPGPSPESRARMSASARNRADRQQGA